MRIAVLTPPIDGTARKDIEDTEVQARQVTAALHQLGHVPLAATWHGDGERTAGELDALAPDCVFNLVEDVNDGPHMVHVVPAFLEGRGIPCTGASRVALEDLGDKRRMKTMLAQAGLPVAAGLDSAAPGTRFIVKSAIEHSSLGLSEASVVNDREAAAELIARKEAEFGGPWFAEAYIEGREFNLAILETPDGPLALPPSEILFVAHGDRPKVLGYDEKWAVDSNAFASTPRVFPTSPDDAPLLLELRRLAIAAWDAFALTGYARVDFRVDAEGRPVILEVNANPCLTDDAGFCAAAMRAGLSQADVVSHLIAAALL